MTDDNDKPVLLAGRFQLIAVSCRGRGSWIRASVPLSRAPLRGVSANAVKNQQPTGGDQSGGVYSIISFAQQDPAAPSFSDFRSPRELVLPDDVRWVKPTAIPRLSQDSFFFARAVAGLTGRPYSAYIPLDIPELHCGEPWRGRFDQQREALTAARQRTEAENLYSS